jgi:hypothetical protein
MRYVIDGYNLLYAWGLAPRGGGPRQLERARENLLRRLRQCGGGHRLTVVFDARNAPAEAAGAQEYHGIHVRFPRDGTADDWIEDLLRREGAPQDVTVVSDDHRLRQAAERRRCRSLRCLDYVVQLQQPRPAAPPAPPAEGPSKPEAPSPEETRHWLETFGEED